MLHVPYKGTTPAQVDVISGQAALMFVSMRGIAEHVETGEGAPLGDDGGQARSGVPEDAHAGGVGIPRPRRDRLERVCWRPPARLPISCTSSRARSAGTSPIPNSASAWRARGRIRRRARPKRSARSSGRKPPSGKK